MSSYSKKSNRTIRKKFSLLMLGVVFLLVSFGVLTAGGGVLAEDINLQIGIPTGEGVVNKVSGFPEYIKLIYNLFIGMVGILAVIMVMVGGFQWLLAAGNAQKIEGAKTTIISAIMGLVLALSSWQILELVNPDLTMLRLAPAPIKKQDWDPNMPYCNKSSGAEPDKVATGVDKGTYGGGLILGYGSGFKCGKVYPIIGTDQSCVGIQCPSSGAVDPGRCVRESSGYNCYEALRLIGLKQYGYPPLDYEDEWPFSTAENCGAAKYKSKAAGNKNVIGVSCTDNVSTLCVLDMRSGLGGVTKYNKDNPDSMKDLEIGKLIGSKCVSVLVQIGK